MTQGEARRQVAWAELGFVTAIAAGVLAFLSEARGVSLDPQNLLAMVAAFGLFTLGLEAVGYDVAICVFVLAGLVIGGERHPAALLIFPPVFTLAVIHGFRLLIPYPFPTSIL
jgi:hypothetical protein